MTDKPDHTLREGSLGVSIWKREGRRGSYYEITASRSYFNKENESYGYTTSLRPWNLEPLSKLLVQARAWIREHSDEEITETPHDAAEVEEG